MMRRLQLSPCLVSALRQQRLLVVLDQPSAGLGDMATRVPLRPCLSSTPVCQSHVVKAEDKSFSPVTSEAATLPPQPQSDLLTAGLKTTSFIWFLVLYKMCFLFTIMLHT